VVVKMNEQMFEDKISSLKGDFKFKSDKPAMVKFGAEWCNPCKIVAPIVKELAEEYKGKVDIYEVDTEAEPELAMKFNVMSIPALVFIPLEGDLKMQTGAIPKSDFKKIFKELFEV